MKDKALRQKRDAQVNLDYVELDKEGFRNKEILEILSAKYFLKPRTIYAIVSGEYERRRQKPSGF